MRELKPPKNWPEKQNHDNLINPNHSFERGWNSAIDACWQAHIDSLPTVEEIEKVIYENKWYSQNVGEVRAISQEIRKLLEDGK